MAADWIGLAEWLDRLSNSPEPVDKIPEWAAPDKGMPIRELGGDKQIGPIKMQRGGGKKI